MSKPYYFKSKEELKKIIDEVSEKLFKEFIDTDNCFGVRDESSKGFVVHYNRNQWNIVE